MEAVVVAEGGLPRVKELLRALEQRGVSAAVLPPSGGCRTGCGTKYRLAVPSEALEEAKQLLGPPPDAPVVDFNASEMTCPACGHEFATGPSECPDCGLFLG